MNYRQIHSLPDRRVRSLFGLTKSQLAELFACVLPKLEILRQQESLDRPGKPARKRAPGAGRKRMLVPYQELLLTLVYLRHNVSHAVCGQLFDVSADVSEDTFHTLIRVLRQVCPSDRWDAEKHWRKGEPSWQPDPDDRLLIDGLLLIDSFETPVPRPSEAQKQKRLYSGKKRRHTLKTQVVTDQTGQILSIDAGHRGPKHDKTIYDESGIEARFPDSTKQADLAYIGVPGMIVPHKRKNKYKIKPIQNELTEEQKAQNKQLASRRVYVEHAIRRIKAWRILRDEYRLATGLFSTIAHATVGLVQMSQLCT